MTQSSIDVVQFTYTFKGKTYTFCSLLKKLEKGLPINSSGKMIKNLKKVIRDCVDKDWLDKDPFWRFNVKHVDPKVVEE